MFELSERMKNYESISYGKLPRRIPVIVRVDGRSFHSVTRSHPRVSEGWCAWFSGQMLTAAINVVRDMQGCNFAYVQSDEASFLLTDYRTISTDAWFGYEISKIVSISAAKMSTTLSTLLARNVEFDSRAFSLPKDEVCNYFIWRQRDATRNAIQMAGRLHYSHKELHGKNNNEIQEMLFKKGINFNDFQVAQRRGMTIVNGAPDVEPPIFSQNREYVERFINIRED